MLAINPFSDLAIGQHYQSVFSADTNSWNVAFCAPDLSSTTVYYSLSDTTIDGKKYHILQPEKVYTKEQKLTYQDKSAGWLREDTSTGDLWQRTKRWGNEMESRVMSLNLEVGDSMEVVKSYLDMTYKWIHIDSVYYENGRKVLKADYVLQDCYSTYHLKYIEGIGPTIGFNYDQHNYQYSPFYLMCKYANAEIVYQVDMLPYRHCIQTSNDIPDMHMNGRLSITPNPSSGRFTLFAKDPSLYTTYLVFNALEKLVAQGCFVNQTNSLEIAHQGIYIMVVRSGGVVTAQRLVVTYI